MSIGNHNGLLCFLFTCYSSVKKIEKCLLKKKTASSSCFLESNEEKKTRHVDVCRIQ